MGGRGECEPKRVTETMEVYLDQLDVRSLEIGSARTGSLPSQSDWPTGPTDNEGLCLVTALVI